jgi:hypothetical protein
MRCEMRCALEEYGSGEAEEDADDGEECVEAAMQYRLDAMLI